MIHRQALHLAATIDASMVIGRFDRSPLLRRQVVDGGTFFQGTPPRFAGVVFLGIGTAPAVASGTLLLPMRRIIGGLASFAVFLRSFSIQCRLCQFFLTMLPIRCGLGGFPLLRIGRIIRFGSQTVFFFGLRRLLARLWHGLTPVVSPGVGARKSPRKRRVGLQTLSVPYRSIRHTQLYPKKSM